MRCLLDRPQDEVGRRRIDAEPLELGGDLAAVVGRVVDDVAEDGPERQAQPPSLEGAVRPDGREPLGRERGEQAIEGVLGRVEELGGVVQGGELGLGRPGGDGLAPEALAHRLIASARWTSVARVEDQPGAGSWTYCSDVSLRAAATTRSSAQRL